MFSSTHDERAHNHGIALLERLIESGDVTLHHPGLEQELCNTAAPKYTPTSQSEASLSAQRALNRIAVHRHQPLPYAPATASPALPIVRAISTAVMTAIGLVFDEPAHYHRDRI